MRRYVETGRSANPAAYWALVSLTWAVISAGPAWGVSLYKADNATALNVTTSWLTTAVGGGGVVPAAIPGTDDTATWAGTYTAARTGNIGSNATWGAIAVSNCNGKNPMTIGVTGGTLTLNGGIDMSSADVDFSIACPVTLGGPQAWNVGSNLTLTVGTGAIALGANTLTVGGAGNATLSGVIGSSGAGLTMSGSGILTLSGANTFTGGVLITSGTVVANISNATTNSGALGPSASAATLGDAAGGSASLLANQFTVSNPINLGSSAAGARRSATMVARPRPPSAARLRSTAGI